MFGNEYDIVREFNAYFLDYQEQYDADTRWTDRIISSSGDWSGNVYDFYFRVYNKLIQDIKVPFKMDGGVRVDDTTVHGRSHGNGYGHRRYSHDLVMAR